MLAIIGGSQSYRLLEQGAMPGERIKPIPTPYGDSPPLRVIRTGGREFIYLSRHGETGYSVGAPFVNYRANIYALKEMGVDAIVAWSGPGSLDPSLKPGQLVVPHDLIDETKSRESTFYKGTGLGFIRMRNPFCPTLRGALSSGMTALKAEVVDKAVYVCVEGPRMETPAEVAKYRTFGGQLIGMTLCPEAFLARELEMCYAACCFVTNFAEGMSDTPDAPEEVFGGLATAAERDAANATASRFPDIVAALLNALPGVDRTCTCQRAMERFRRRGLIGNDWHEWVRA